MLTGADRDTLRTAIEQPVDAEMTTVIALIDRSGGIDYTREVALAEVAKARAALAPLAPRRIGTHSPRWPASRWIAIAE